MTGFDEEAADELPKLQIRDLMARLNAVLESLLRQGYVEVEGEVSPFGLKIPFRVKLLLPGG